VSIGQHGDPVLGDKKQTNEPWTVKKSHNMSCRKWEASPDHIGLIKVRWQRPNNFAYIRYADVSSWQQKQL